MFNFQYSMKKTNFFSNKIYILIISWVLNNSIYIKIYYRYFYNFMFFNFYIYNFYYF